MSEAVALQPYLNSTYWEGLMIGDGQPTPVDPNAILTPDTISSLRFAKQSLQDRLAAMHTYYPLQTFNKGSEFDPDNFASGSVVLYDREVLRRAEPKAELFPDVYANLEVPERPTDLDPCLGEHEYGVMEYSDTRLGITYNRSMQWGIVVPTKYDRKGLLRVSAFSTYKDNRGRVHASAFKPETVPVHVGETNHYLRGADRLERVNIMHVILAGSAKRQKSRPALPWLSGRLAMHQI